MRTLTHEGLTLTINEWAARTNQSPQSLRYRLNSGWPVSNALNKPTGTRGRSAHKDEVNAERQRCQRTLKANAKQIRREFGKLINDMDRALNAFNLRLAWILKDTDDTDTPGVVADQSKSAPDRPTRTAQDGV